MILNLKYRHLTNKIILTKHVAYRAFWVFLKLVPQEKENLFLVLCSISSNNTQKAASRSFEAYKHSEFIRTVNETWQRDLHKSQEGREVGGRIASNMLVCFWHVTYLIIASQKVSYTARIYKSEIKLHNIFIRTGMILWHVDPLLKNELTNTFPWIWIIGNQPVTGRRFRG
jgi:hypothetical protein